MGSIAEGLKKLGAENTQAIETGEAILSGVMGCVSIYSSINAAIKLVGLFNSPEKDTLTTALANLHDDFRGLLTEVLDEVLQHDEFQRLRLITRNIEQSRTAADIAIHYLTDPDHYEIKDAYRDSRNSVMELCNDSSFRRVFTPSLVTHVFLYGGNVDYNSGQVIPTKDFPFNPPDDTWDYRYVLPALIEAISNHLIVIRALEPLSYIQSHRKDLQDLAEALYAIHNKMLAGIKLIVPDHHEVVRVNIVGNGYYSGPINGYFFGWWGFEVGKKEANWHGTIGYPDLEVICCPCGAVDSYSGLYSFHWYKEYLADQFMLMYSGSQAFESHGFQDFFTRFYAYSLKYKKNVYRDVGLPAVWNAFVNLKIFLGESIPTPPEILNGWSIRTVANTLLPFGSFQLGANREISLRRLMSSMDYPPYRTSLKQVLENPMTISPDTRWNWKNSSELPRGELGYPPG